MMIFGNLDRTYLVRHEMKEPIRKSIGKWMRCFFSLFCLQWKVSQDFRWSRGNLCEWKLWKSVGNGGSCIALHNFCIWSWRRICISVMAWANGGFWWECWEGGTVVRKINCGREAEEGDLTGVYICKYMLGNYFFE